MADAVVHELPNEDEALDAYSRIVTTVAERLAPSVANLRVRRARRGREAVGGGSAVVLREDGFLLTCAHVVGADDARGRAAFIDGGEPAFEVVGRDPLTDWWSRSGTRTAWAARSPPASSRRSAGRCLPAAAAPSARSPT
jgi:S1-C subfamily serine protease